MKTTNHFPGKNLTAITGQHSMVLKDCALFINGRVTMFNSGDSSFKSLKGW